MNRRDTLKSFLLLAGGPLVNAQLFGGNVVSPLFPIRAITKGPKFHWFGYYDKLQFDPTNRYVLGMEVGFEHRSPEPDDEIRIGMIDLEDNDRWIDLGSSVSWG